MRKILIVSDTFLPEIRSSTTIINDLINYSINLGDKVTLITQKVDNRNIKKKNFNIIEVNNLFKKKGEALVLIYLLKKKFYFF